MYALANKEGQYLYKSYAGFYSFTTKPNLLFFSMAHATNWLTNNSDRIVYLNMEDIRIVDYKLEDLDNDRIS